MRNIDSARWKVLGLDAPPTDKFTHFDQFVDGQDFSAGNIEDVVHAATGGGENGGCQVVYVKEIAHARSIAPNLEGTCVKRALEEGGDDRKALGLVLTGSIRIGWPENGGRPACRA